MSWLQFHRGYLLGHLLFFAALCLSGCAHHAGDICRGDDSFCAGVSDRKAALVCRDGKLIRFGCYGPKGCEETNKNRAVDCDQSAGALPGEPCLADYEGGGHCSADPGAYLQCVKGSWVQLPCGTGKTCDPGGPRVTCK